MDKNGKLVNKKGWLVNPEGQVIDLKKDIKFSKDQLSKEGDLPRLFNYQGRRFDIKDVMGDLEKDSEGKIKLTPKTS
jgi:hypothetical protein